MIIEGSLEVKLRTIWTDGKAEVGRVRERREEERRSEKRKCQKKEDACARKGRKAAKHCVAPMICGSRGSKSRLAKAAGAGPSGRWKLHAVAALKHLNVRALLEAVMWKKCSLLWRKAHFQVKMYKALECRGTFGSWDVEKVHAAVARSTFRSHNAKNTWGPERF